ncbi:hypothetical protein A5677_24220 [Mycobacterium malmoense]|uniref:Uncharacterized protein n=2 Tax=Mycobacterium malmoense TaxID=1780 RepID=A0A1B9D422_MYCMA|nr:hypothetical protein A5677_24220 [Mycobacterium malmoense]
MLGSHGPTLTASIQVVRRRQHPAGRAARALLVSGAIIPTILASALIAAMMFWALPSGAALNERHVLLLNVVTACIYSAISIPSAIVWGYLWLTIPASADEGIEGRTILARRHRSDCCARPSAR